MVFTHTPSNLITLWVALTASFPLAAGLYLIRESLTQMEVPTRQSDAMAVVQPDERTFVSGVTGLVRLGGWAVAPGLAGFFHAGPLAAHSL